METLDIQDDHGALLALVGDAIPENIKQASITDLDVNQAPDDLFALVIERAGQPPLRKFACSDGPTTYVSALYLTQTYRHLTPAAVKTAAKSLLQAADVYRVTLPADVAKLAATGGLSQFEEPETKVAGLDDMLKVIRERRQENKLRKTADLTGTELTPVGTPRPPTDAVKKLAAVDNHVSWSGPTVEEIEPPLRLVELGVKTAGGNTYPLDKVRDLMDLERAFAHNITAIPVDDRVKVACAVVEREQDMGLPSGAPVLKYAGKSFRSARELEQALWSRVTMGKRAHKDTTGYNKLAAIKDPQEYAEKLAAVDRSIGLDREWDRGLEDPWAATLSAKKTAEVIYNQNGVFVSDHQLERMAAKEPKKVLCAILDADMVEEFIKDPVGVFRSMPEPMKQSIGRLANDPLWRADP
jgi:hypothetical protein